MSILIILIILIGLYYIFLHIHDEPKNFIEDNEYEEIILEEPKKCKIILEEPKKEPKKDDIIDDYEIYALSCS